MKRLQRAAIVTELAEQLTAQGSWCGETHLQKATYFLQELLEVPTGFEFAAQLIVSVCAPAPLQVPPAGVFASVPLDTVALQPLSEPLTVASTRP